MINKERFCKLLGYNLRKERLKKAFTVEKLALEAGLTYSQVSRIELGKRNPTAYTLFILSNTLGVNPANFLSITKNEMETSDHTNGALTEKPNE